MALDLSFEIILRYLEGSATELETEEFFEWIELDNKNKELFFKVKDIYDSINYKELNAKELEAAWLEITKKQQLPHAYQTKIIKWKWIGYAASLVLICGIGIYFFSKKNGSNLISHEVSLNNEKKLIALPDGSTIWLKPGSKISYLSDFEERLVNLSGNGFFNIEKIIDKNGQRKPFLIHCNDLNISIKGTSFNVNSSKNKSSVVVNTGIVDVQYKQKHILLHPGNFAKTENGELKTGKVNANLYKSWTTGEYTFENTKINEIKDLLEVNYSVSVKIVSPEKFNNVSLNGRLVAHTEDELLNVLKLMLSASITKNNNLITIKSL